MKWIVENVDSCPSTNTELVERPHVQHGTVLITRDQTAGRGRLGRAWLAPRGTQISLTAALLPSATTEFGLLPLAAGLALTDTIPQARLKWPNDGLIDGKKFCGILCEGAADEDAPCGMRAVIGMGINVTLTEFPPEYADRATSLTLAGLPDDRERIITELLRNLSHRVDQWAAGEDFLDEYRAVCATIGQEIRLIAPGGDVYGHVDGIAPDGRLIVSGQPYSAGDVTHVRPAH